MIPTNNYDYWRAVAQTNLIDPLKDPELSFFDEVFVDTGDGQAQGHIICVEEDGFHIAVKSAQKTFRISFAQVQAMVKVDHLFRQTCYPNVPKNTAMRPLVAKYHGRGSFFQFGPIDQRTEETEIHNRCVMFADANIGKEVVVSRIVGSNESVIRGIIQAYNPDFVAVKETWSKGTTRYIDRHPENSFITRISFLASESIESDEPFQIKRQLPSSIQIQKKQKA